jgi:hypothetical protein
MSSACIIFTDAKPDDLLAIYMTVISNVYDRITIIAGSRGKYPDALAHKIRIMCNLIQSENEIKSYVTVVSGCDYLYRDNPHEYVELFTLEEVSIYKKVEIPEITEDKKITLPKETIDSISDTFRDASYVTLLFFTNPQEFMRYKITDMELFKVRKAFMLGDAYLQNIETSDWTTCEGKTSYNWSMSPKAVQEFINFWNEKAYCRLYICPCNLAKQIVGGNIGETKTPLFWKAICESNSKAIQFISQDAENWKNFLTDMGQTLCDGDVEIANMMTWFTSEFEDKINSDKVNIHLDLNKCEPRIDVDINGACPILMTKESKSKIYWIHNFYTSRDNIFDNICTQIFTNHFIDHYYLIYKFVCDEVTIPTNKQSFIDFVETFKSDDKRINHEIKLIRDYLYICLSNKTKRHVDSNLWELGLVRNILPRTVVILKSHFSIICLQSGFQEESYYIRF